MWYDNWHEVISYSDIEAYTKQFLFKMEEPTEQGDEVQQKRIATAELIFSNMGGKRGYENNISFYVVANYSVYWMQTRNRN